MGLPGVRVRVQTFVPSKNLYPWHRFRVTHDVTHHHIKPSNVTLPHHRQPPSPSKRAHCPPPTPLSACHHPFVARSTSGGVCPHSIGLTMVNNPTSNMGTNDTERRLCPGILILILIYSITNLPFFSGLASLT